MVNNKNKNNKNKNKKDVQITGSNENLESPLIISNNASPVIPGIIKSAITRSYLFFYQ